MKTYTARKAILFSMFAGLMFFSIPNTASAQVNFGILAGLNYGQLNDIEVGSASSTFDNSSGYHIGVFVDFKLGPLAVRPALVYTKAGSLFNGASFLADSTSDFDLNFLVIPVDFRLGLPIPFVKPYIFTGPEFRLIAGTDAPDGFDEELKSFSMTWSAGLGVQINVPVIGITLYPEFRYSFDVSGLTNDKEFDLGAGTVTTSEEPSANMYMLRLGIGF